MFFKSRAHQAAQLLKKLKQAAMGDELVFCPMKIQSYYQKMFSQSKKELEP